jgi:hypothetical protein
VKASRARRSTYRSRSISRVLRAAVVAVLGLSVPGCGTVVYQHTVEVLVSDPSRRLGPPPIDVSVFDRQMGSTGDWAKKWMGPTSDQAPYETQHTSTKTVTIFDPPRPPDLEVSVAVPAYESRGYFWLLLKPGSSPSGEQRAGFVPYGDSFPADQVPTMTVQYTATPEPKGWHLVLRLQVPPAP